jgi:hypothetical protein
MTDGTEAAADALTGALVAREIEGQASSMAQPRLDEARGTCRNCGATLAGAYCAACGQAAHIHRTLASLGHDILHSVFHFDGKFWRTIPELVVHPGRLTRRYVDGERAKFISPMALYLFTVFLMYAVFSLTGGAGGNVDLTQLPGVGDFQAGNRAALETTVQNIQALENQLDDLELSADRRAEITREIAELESARTVIEAVASGDWERLEGMEEVAAARRVEGAQEAESARPPSALERQVKRGFEQARDNPSLMAFKLRTNGYKYSWALVPLSIPFVWLLFFWRRDIGGYDHAVFVTYSISFMMLLLIAASLLRTAGVGWGLIALGTQVVPPVHMYRQLRGAYGLSRGGALVRLFFLLVAAATVLSLFLVLLLWIGALG